MKKIEKLTPEQESRMAEYRDKWIKIGLCPDPADRPRAEAAIRQAYRAAGIAEPKKIVWCGSPLSQGLTRAIILDKKLLASVRDSVWDSVGDSVRDSVRDSVGDSVRASVWDSVRDSVRDSVWDSVGDSVRDSVRDSVWASVRASVWDSVGASVRASVWASVGASVGASVRASVWDSVRDSVRDSVWDSVWASVGASVGASVRDSVWDSVWASVRDSVRASVWDSVRDSVWASGYGQHDANWLAWTEYFRDVVGLKAQTDKLAGLIDHAKSAGWYLAHQHICWVSERHHILERDERGRLHCAAGPAVMYPDGWAIYAWHGVRLPAAVIKEQDKTTPKQILDESNVEVRRAMIEIYGQGRFAQDAGAKVVDHDQDRGAELMVLPLPADDPERVMKAVRLTCPTTGNLYFERVPPDVSNVAEALAWRFRVTPKQYSPKWEC